MSALLRQAVRNALHNIEALSESHRGLSEDLQAPRHAVGFRVEGVWGV